MPSDKFLSLSKLNKKYFNPYSEDNRLFNFDMNIHALLKYDDHPSKSAHIIDFLQNNFYAVQQGFFSQFNTKYRFLINSLVPSERQIIEEEYYNIYNALITSDNFYCSLKFYPFSLSHFIDNYYSDYLPSEVDFIIEFMLADSMIINHSNCLIIVKKPFTHDLHFKIKQYWNDNISINNIISNIKSIEKMVNAHKKDLKYLINKNDTLSEENLYLKKQNSQLIDELSKTTNMTWS